MSADSMNSVFGFIGILAVGCRDILPVCIF